MRFCTSNRKNHRGNDKFTGRTAKRKRFRFDPVGLNLYRDSPASAKQSKRARVKRMRISVDIEY